MTLIINEIHLRKGLSDTFQIAAADRRITRGDIIEKPRRKLFSIPYLNAVISYFGLASFVKSGKKIYLSDWLPDFITKSNLTNDLKAFADNLRDTLNKEIPLEYRKKYHSGFHLSGYRRDGLPEFWHFSNISGMTGPCYNAPVENYANPSSDFLERDAIKLFHWDGLNPESANNGTQIYRNGDIRIHAIVFEVLDKTMIKIMKLPDFNRPETIEQYTDYVKFKFEFISYIYKHWAQKKIISKPIDIIILTKEGLIEKKNNKWQRTTSGHTPLGF